jgi:nucleoside-diphosphate-sugar epimerase
LAVGRPGAARRLLDSLEVDASKLRRDLGWTPPFAAEEGLRATAAWFAGT